MCACVGRRGEERLFFSQILFPFHIVNHLEQILPILVLEHRLCQLAHPLFGNPSLSVCNALQTTYLQALALFEHLYISGGF